MAMAATAPALAPLALGIRRALGLPEPSLPAPSAASPRQARSSLETPPLPVELAPALSRLGPPADARTFRRATWLRAVLQARGLTPGDSAVKPPLRRLVEAYYPVGHARLHLVPGSLPLAALGPVGRVDEIGRLRTAVLSVPFALDGAWAHSPSALEDGFQVDLHRALLQHAALTRLLLRRGVEVTLTFQPAEASEAVYATDAVSAVGQVAVVGNPRHAARRREVDAYLGGLRLGDYGGAEASVEFGDVLLHRRGDTVYVLQGYNSLRGTEASLAAMRAALVEVGRRSPGLRFVQVPVKLASRPEAGVLHLDYVLNYAGEGARRVMVVHPESLADPGQVQALAELLEVPPGNVLRVPSREAMKAGAANLASLGPRTVLYVRNPHADPIAAQLRARGLEVIQLDYDQMSQKDGTLHCCIGQLRRDF